MSARFIIVARSEMPSIAQKVAVCKGFGVYPKDEDIEFHARPDLVTDDMCYVIDKRFVEASGLEDYDFLSVAQVSERQAPKT